MILINKGKKVGEVAGKRKIKIDSYSFEKLSKDRTRFHIGKVKELNYCNTGYVVRAVIYNKKLGISIPLEYHFFTKKKAETFFNEFIKEYPLSVIIMEKEVVTAIKNYI